MFASVVGCSFAVDDYRVADSTDARADSSAATDADDATPATDAFVDAPLGDADADAVCDPTLFSCGGFCVDLSNDSKNCGMCGHSCPSGQCKKGNCK